MHCPTCKLPSPNFKFFGFCEPCYERAVKLRGELATLVTSYGMRRPAEYFYQKYEYHPFDTVYAHFHRIARVDGIDTIMWRERQWCLMLTYEDGYPCPPKVKFVNPYRHDDDSPMFWPRLSVYSDPVRQVLALPYIHERCKATATISEDPKKAARQWQPHMIVDLIAEKIVNDLF